MRHYYVRTSFMPVTGRFCRDHPLSVTVLCRCYTTDGFTWVTIAQGVPSSVCGEPNIMSTRFSFISIVFESILGATIVIIFERVTNMLNLTKTKIVS